MKKESIWYDEAIKIDKKKVRKNKKEDIWMKTNLDTPYILVELENPKTYLTRRDLKILNENKELNINLELNLKLKVK